MITLKCHVVDIVTSCMTADSAVSEMVGIICNKLLPYNPTGLCILLYSSVSTYVKIYGSSVFNFGSYVSLPTLFACFLGFNIPTSSFILLKMFFIILV